MSRDPFKELFGPSSGDAPEPAPAPVPARDRLAYEQAERVRTSQLPAGKRTPPAGVDAHPRDRSAQAKPWIVVGIVAVLAIIASIVILNLARGSEQAPQPTAQPTTQAPTTTSPTTPADDDDDDSDAEQPEGPPAVDVGATYDMAIGPWDATSQISQRFGSISFNIPDGTNLVLTSDLLNSFPESCAAMRQGWGATKTGAGYEVLKPAERCAEAPELYDEVWGLVDAWVKTIR
ncbi:hypothetical protein Leucomu_03405 [Leucobacter muris]|uniref:Serine/threonine protein kinase n=1 Tax=Leucobacter muris TaxID=1935379 RepID=A0ABX5QDF4_9MICO|nr:hypothetical protein [Leucobacter muris]QAB17089.1 hypothetical protein Leucomu_03405 [Leucobacter muris]